MSRIFIILQAGNIAYRNYLHELQHSNMFSRPAVKISQSVSLGYRLGSSLQCNPNTIYGLQPDYANSKYSISRSGTASSPVVLSEFLSHLDLGSCLFHCRMPKLSTVIIILRLNSFLLSFISRMKNNMSYLQTFVKWGKKRIWQNLPPS